jgi:putative transmembrane protein PGPGW
MLMAPVPQDAVEEKEDARSIMGAVSGDAPGKGSRGMIRRMRDGWWRFKAGKPGHRFRNRYRRNRRRGQGRFALRKVLVIVGGTAIAVASLLLAPLPGPGWGTLLGGLVILAGELLILARFLDRAEIKLRGPARRAKFVWASLPADIRLLIGIVVPVCGAVSGLWALLTGLRWLM